jgi:hypothetical protein
VLVGTGLYWKNLTSVPKTYDFAPTSAGAHLMLIVGFDKTNPHRPYFLVKNSWGEGVLRVAYEVFQKGATNIGWIKGVREPSWHHPSRWIGSWNINTISGMDGFLSDVTMRPTSVVTLAFKELVSTNIFPAGNLIACGPSIPKAQPR